MHSLGNHAMQTDPDPKELEANATAAAPWWRRADILIAGVIVLAVVAYIGLGAYRNSRRSNEPQATAAVPSKEALAAFQQYTKEGLNYYYQTKEYDKAEQAFRKSIEYAPNDALGYNNLGSALNDQKKWDEAIIVLGQAVELNPNLAIARNNLAWARAQKAKQGQ
jgi:tetratricopeptide (TPR) repeat protein